MPLLIDKTSESFAFYCITRPPVILYMPNQIQQGPPRVARKIPLLLPQTPSIMILASTQPFSQEALQTAQYLLQQCINNNSNNSNTEHGDATEELTNIAEKRPAIFHHGNNNEDRSHKHQKQKCASLRCRKCGETGCPSARGQPCRKEQQQKSPDRS
ncbi:hypothetical protein INT45_005265 [Circinella minor]|uniref:Uncharacterized protein n=1 Tax=Circinella minor TaxID=1195481 RepID=A0A8H7VBC4_9FUNG|nr:hypothetical protein INT45_005265 [Circinella minor]